MSNYKEEKTKIKSIEEFLLNILKSRDSYGKFYNLSQISLSEYLINILQSKNDFVKEYERSVNEDGFEEREEVFKMISSKIEYRKEQEIEIKKNLIPAFLKYEVQEIVDSHYQSDWTSYLKSVDLYFDKISFESLTLINEYEKDKSFFNGATSKEKKKMRRKIFSIISHCSVLLKLVGHDRSWYCCKSIISEYKSKIRKEREFINSRSVIGEDGKEFPLKKCVASKEQKVAEKLNQIDALQKIALKRDWTFAFITMTNEGEFFPLAKNEEMRESVYSGASPFEAHIDIEKSLQRTRSLLAKRGMKAGEDYIAEWSAEAHKPGVKHKHIIIFCSIENIEKLRSAFYFHFKNMERMRGHKKDPFRVEEPENRLKPWKKQGEEYIKGKFRIKASSYIFKYIMKSINSIEDMEIEDLMNLQFINKKKEDLTKEEEENNSKYNTLANMAFRSFNSIRGFGFIGFKGSISKFRFVARNFKNIKGLDKSWEKYFVKNENEKGFFNNLFELIEKGFFELVENVYITMEDNSKRMVGVKVNGELTIKRFFSLVKQAVIDTKERIKLYQDMAIKKGRETLKSIENGGVIVVPNYSRDNMFYSNAKEKELFKAENWKEYIKNNPIEKIEEKKEVKISKFIKAKIEKLFNNSPKQIKVLNRDMQFEELKGVAMVNKLIADKLKNRLLHSL